MFALDLPCPAAATATDRLHTYTPHHLHPTTQTNHQISPDVVVVGAAKNGTEAYKIEGRDRFPMHSSYVDAEQIAKFVAQRAGACVGGWLCVVWWKGGWGVD